MVLRNIFAALLCGVLLANCGGGSGASSPSTLTIMAGSEIKDLEPLFPEIEKATGVHLDVSYSGTLAGIDRIESGDATPDVAWFSQAKYFTLTDTKHLIKESSKTMLSPVIIGVKESKARELGWDKKPVTWSDIGAAASAGKLRFAMTNPTTSNSGFSAVVSLATALAGSGDVIRADQVNSAKLSGFFSGQKLLSGSSGWLSDAYVNSQGSLDAMVNYESLLLALNASGKLSEPFHLVYPHDGVVTADYPFMLLNDAKRDAYQKVLAFIRTPAFQEKIMKSTYRRPIDASVKPLSAFPNDVLVETPFPNSRSAVDSILFAYLNKHRVPAHAYFVLDTSGSMDGERIAKVRDAFHVLTGSDNSITGRFARFDDREAITIITFSSQVNEHRDFAMHSANDVRTFKDVATFVDGLSADGDTAIYDALDVALDEAQKDPDSRYPSIVLMTDGENNHGETAEAFEAKYAQRGKKIRIFPIFIGEANPVELTKIAELSGGRAFDARTASMTEVFKDIRGYQ